MRLGHNSIKKFYDANSSHTPPSLIVSIKRVQLGRSHFPIGELGTGYNNKYQFGDINQLKNQCPAEIAIFVHGWGIDKFKAKESLDRVKMSLENNNYSIPLIGLSWDSNRDE